MTVLARRLATAIAAIAVIAIALPVSADPPPWAPAHGWREKHGGGRDRVIERIIELPGRGIVEYLVPQFYSRGVGINLGRCDRSLLASELDGGAIGQALGGGLLGTLGGVAIGALVDDATGADFYDQACIAQALELAQPGNRIAWVNPETQAQFSVLPSLPLDRDGQPCRSFATENTYQGRTVVETGLACRQPDGSWLLVD